MIAYGALCVAFLTTVAGVVGNTWDVKRRGLRRLTKAGAAVVLLALATLTLGVMENRKKDLAIRDVKMIRHVANRHILNAVSYLVRHLSADARLEGLDNQQVFSVIRDPSNLSKLGRSCLIGGAGGVADGYGGVGGFFKHPWQLHEFNINHGRTLLDDVLVKYSAFLEPVAILRINDVLADEFLVTKFSFAGGSKGYIDLASDEIATSAACSGWGALGLYYFNAVYLPGDERAPEYRVFLALLAKIEALVEYASEQDALRVFAKN